MHVVSLVVASCWASCLERRLVGRHKRVVTELACLFFRRRGSAGERRHGGHLLSWNKVGGPRVSSRVKMKIYRMPILIDMAGVSCSGRFHRRS
jgi:hypothetical protein